MKTIVTHKSPHLDEICAIWLLNRYHPDCKRFRLRFVAQGSPLAVGAKKPKSSELLIGTGLGTFDEHTGKMEDSAATLVFKFLDQSGLLPKEPYKRKAVEAVVEHARLTDFAENYQFPHLVREFLPEAIIGGMKKRYSDSVVVRQGIDLIESLYLENRAWEETVTIWPSRIEFRTQRYEGVGLQGHPIRMADRLAYDEGYDFVVLVDTKYGRRQFRASTRSNVDFTPVYNVLLHQDKDARWYLHHSGKMLLSGSETMGNGNVSRLTLDELIDIAKRVL
jgi:hypothetical protein